MAVTSPNHTSLDGLRDRVRMRSDHVNSAFVSDAEVEQYIQESYFELYDLLIESVGPQHFADGTSITTTAGVASYTLSEDNGEGVLLPINIYKMLGVDVLLDGVYRPIRPDQYYNRGRRENDLQGWTSEVLPRYLLTTDVAADIQARVIHFTPTPQAVYTVNLLYIPTPRALIGDGTTAADVSFLHFAHWDEYIVVDAAMKVLEKEESDVTHLAIRKQQLRDRIVWHANTMDTDEAGCVRDIAISHGWRNNGIG